MGKPFIQRSVDDLRHDIGRPDNTIRRHRRGSEIAYLSYYNYLPACPLRDILMFIAEYFQCAGSAIELDYNKPDCYGVSMYRRALGVILECIERVESEARYAELATRIFVEVK